MRAPHTARAAHRGEGGDPQNTDLAGRLSSTTDSPARRAAQALFRGGAIASPSSAPTTHKPILPRVAEAHQRDRLAREQIAQGKDSGEPEVQIDYAGAIRRHEFASARRRRGRT